MPTLTVATQSTRMWSCESTVLHVPTLLDPVPVYENAGGEPIATHRFPQSSEAIRSPRLHRIGGLGSRRHELGVTSSERDAEAHELAAQCGSGRE